MKIVVAPQQEFCTPFKSLCGKKGFNGTLADTDECVIPKSRTHLVFRMRKAFCMYMLLHDKKKEGNINYNPVLARIALLSLYIFVCMYIFLPHTVYIQVSQIKQGSIKIGLCLSCRISIARTT